MIEEDTNLFPFHTLKRFNYTSNYINKYFYIIMGFPGGSVVENLPTISGDAEDQGSFPGSGRSPGVGNSNLLQYSCLKNPMDKGACWAIVQNVAESRARLSN